MSNYYNDFERDGVILLKDVLPSEAILAVRDEYDKLDKELTNREILKDEPLIVFWKHVVGEQKRICSFKSFPTLWNLINKHITSLMRKTFKDKIKKLQLLETIIFSKPLETSNILHWHQDVSYFPLKPNNQIAIWIPFESVTKESGALNYALGSHKEGAKASLNLHTRKLFDSEDTRSPIPEDPEKSGFKVKCMEMNPTDMLCHSGYTWHYSGPNKKTKERRGLSVRFIIEDAVFDPRKGQGAAFTEQIDVKKGDKFEGKPFPSL